MKQRTHEDVKAEIARFHQHRANLIEYNRSGYVPPEGVFYGLDIECELRILERELFELGVDPNQTRTVGLHYNLIPGTHERIAK